MLNTIDALSLKIFPEGADQSRIEDILWGSVCEIVGLSEISELNEEDYRRFIVASILRVFNIEEPYDLESINDEWSRLVDTDLKDFDLLSIVSDIKFRILAIFLGFDNLSNKGKIEFIEGELRMYETQYGWFMNKDPEFLRFMEIKTAIEELWDGERKYKEEMQETEI